MSVRDVDRAWSLLRAILPLTSESYSDIAAMDRELAAFVAAQPGVFEARLLEGLPELATAEGNREMGYVTALAELFDLRAPFAPGKTPPRENHHLEATLNAVDPIAMLAVHARARRDHEEAMGPTAIHNSVNVAAFLAKRAGPHEVARGPLAPEFRDHVCALAWKHPLPDILGPDVHAMSADAIDERFAEYMGLDVDTVTRRLRAGGGTGGVFLGAGERLGEVVRRDARALHALGVDRHALAEQLDSLVALKNAPVFDTKSWHVVMTSFMGHQDDPFHSADMYGIHRRGATDFQLTNEKLPEPNRINGGDLLIVLIRRACFFEGDVPYRIDPTLAARVLGLID